MTGQQPVVLTGKQRSAMSYAVTAIRVLPESWREVAAETREKQGDSDYARGIASGLVLAAKQLERDLAELAARTPSCEHGKPVTATCLDCA